MFTNTYLPHVGGVARSVSTFVEDLLDRGHQVRVVAPTFTEQQEEEADYIIRVPAIQNFNGSDFSVKIPLAGEIGEKIAKFEPDIIHSHHPFLLGDSAVRTSRLLGVPLVFTHHTRYEQYTHYVPLDSPALKRFVSDLATQYANMCHHAIAPSSGIEKLLEKRGVRSPITVLPTGIDTDLFSSGDRERFRAAFRITNNAPVVGHVGRLALEKNLAFLARAVARAAQAIPELKFLVAGSGEAEADIRNIFHGRDVEQSLIMVGSRTGSELADCYAAMDVFVFASRSETQGLVLAEAMAAGVPVVALSATGVDDVLVEGSNGIKLDTETNDKGFSAAIQKLFEQHEQIASLTPACLETARQFSRQSSCLRLLDLYETVVKAGYPPHNQESDPLDSLLISIRTEWELLQKKTAAALSSITES